MTTYRPDPPPWRPLTDRTPAKRVKVRLRFHHRDGKVVQTGLLQLSHANGLPTDDHLAAAAALVDQWVAAGDLRPRPDGGFDVIRYRPPRRNRP